MSIENYIEWQYRELANKINIEFVSLYQSFSHEKLQEILSTIHYMFVTNYRLMNDRLPTSEFSAHFWAEPSRELIQAISVLRGLQRTLKNTCDAFTIIPYYEDLIQKSMVFLKSSEGSELPPHMEKVELYYTDAIVCKVDAVNLKTNQTGQHYINLKLIGEGSYAQVFSYFDPFYNRKLILKRAKKELNEKEIERFKQEYEQLNNLHSPYIIEVFQYNETQHEYIMEYMDYTLDKYYEKYNSQLTEIERKRIARQILKSFKYIHSKELLHRDISPNNILLKKYDDAIVVKLSDFGLVKVPDNKLTTYNTDFKGYFNDPGLVTEGFYNYGILHETYAITRLLYFVMTGKVNTSKINDINLKKFVEKGLSTNLKDRYQSVDEITQALKQV